MTALCIRSSGFLWPDCVGPTRAVLKRPDCQEAIGRCLVIGHPSPPMHGPHSGIVCTMYLVEGFLSRDSALRHCHKPPVIVALGLSASAEIGVIAYRSRSSFSTRHPPAPQQPKRKRPLGGKAIIFRTRRVLGALQASRYSHIL
ncbi:hypothetical protein QC761_0030790 [Podospora bellae-mahoneyi]|uniref:Uncharacterized protein n=1 Tax=Podospora bellae-mahoneyi TaxID=2093777 RepID=A0ABR0FQU6_9PEZI|nr:hypothetical protein QC761_0030790 [Podospora bellae-mahoneyi]